MRFLLFVEGETERRALPSFLNRWLSPALSRPAGFDVVMFKGFPHFLKDIARRARSHLEGPTARDLVAAIGLLDLCGPQHHDFYPSYLHTAQERAEWGAREIERVVGQSKFRMFFAVHEIEAWLLSQSAIFPDGVRDELARMAKQPEAVDFDEPPARLLVRLYRKTLGKEYKKIVNGKQLFDRLEPATAYEKCPHLKAMLDEMLNLARRAGL